MMRKTLLVEKEISKTQELMPMVSKTIEIEDAHIPFVCRNIIYYSISYFKYFYYCCCLVFDIIGGKDIYIYIFTP